MKDCLSLALVSAACLSSAAFATDVKYSQSWSGSSTCLQYSEATAGQSQGQGQSQTQKGQQTQWSVCDATVSVVCHRPADKQQAREFLWDRNHCVATVVGSLTSSMLSQQAIPFQAQQEFMPGQDALVTPVSFAESNKRILIRSQASMHWDEAPLVELALSREGDFATAAYSTVMLQRDAD